MLTGIKLLHLHDPAEARRRILLKFNELDGNAAATAAALGVSLNTLYRLQLQDAELKDAIARSREALRDEGVRQRGWGEWHRNRGEEQ